jgi:hypothetical protein
MKVDLDVEAGRARQTLGGNSKCMGYGDEVRDSKGANGRVVSPQPGYKIFETESEKYRGKYNMWNMDQKEQIKEIK